MSDQLHERGRTWKNRATRPGSTRSIASFEMAFRMQTAAPEAFDLTSEPASIRAMYGSENNTFAMNCLLARRLVGRNVRVVRVY